MLFLNVVMLLWLVFDNRIRHLYHRINGSEVLCGATVLQNFTKFSGNAYGGFWYGNPKGNLEIKIVEYYSKWLLTSFWLLIFFSLTTFCTLISRFYSFIWLDLCLLQKLWTTDLHILVSSLYEDSLLVNNK